MFTILGMLFFVLLTIAAGMWIFKNWKPFLASLFVLVFLIFSVQTLIALAKPHFKSAGSIKFQER